MCDCKAIVNECAAKAAPYGGMQNGFYGEKKSRESKAKDMMVKTEEDKLSRSV